jgi:hypothetical protein
MAELNLIKINETLYGKKGEIKHFEKEEELLSLCESLTSA